ncbi:SIMPL domain-containing protein [Afifella sp. IM 167]|uniref:SIMPL domain-containing protein n=1 Tax=Afifella sp. IM 167 TaxID=2033586 RepID=UPI001CCDAC42|nr:SIMPL domain-containing protein [Afifella sp. IM 167]MBZ8132185.1 hypothetical protein [Afifella sp. IM 167]
MPKSLASALAVSLALLAAPAFSQGAFAQQPDEARHTISVSASGEASGAPDMAIVTLGVVEEAESAEDALSANSAAMGKITEALKGEGIAARDLQTSGFSIQPVYAGGYPQNSDVERKITGYRVENMLRVRIRDLASAGATLDKVVKLGSNRIEGLSFTMEDSSPLESEARKSAVEDAAARARELAEAAGLTLGPVVSITEQSYGAPRPQMMMARAESSGGAVPMEAGEVTVSVQVNMVWEIKE